MKLPTAVKCASRVRRTNFISHFAKQNISQFPQENYFTFGNAEYFTEKSIPVALANKSRTFVYRQMFCFCLSKPQAWHIITARSVVHITSPFGAVSHHAPACIYLRHDDIQHSVSMICNSFGIDDIHAFGVMWMRECEMFLHCFAKYDIIMAEKRCYYGVGLSILYLPHHV